MNSKILFMPHANIQYSQLKPERRKWVVENCYGKLFDLVESRDYKLAFEASGKTIEYMAGNTPEILRKLGNLIENGNIEPVASPYIHLMLSNVPWEIGLDSLKYSRKIWEKYIGIAPVTGWNPECGWASYIPDIFQKAGFEALVMDADSFFLSFDEIRTASGLNYDVQGHSNKNELFKIESYIKDKPEFLRYLTNPSRAENGLKLLFRSDCMANLLLWYLLGETEGMRKEKINRNEIGVMYKKWKERIDQTGSFIMPYAEDAEYIGSTAYFYVKQYNQARFFEDAPESIRRFAEILDMAKEAGYELATPSEILNQTKQCPDNPCIQKIENGVAWHGGTAKAWMNTEYSLILDPVCRSLFEGICAIARAQNKSLDALEGKLDMAVKALASAWVSDARWPPAPTSPGRFNVEEALEDLKTANSLIGQYMESVNMGDKRSIYSARLMATQIKAAEDKLMNMTFFGEEEEI